MRSHELGGFSWGKSSLHCTCGAAEMILSEHEQVLRVGGRVYGLSPVYELQGGASMPGGAGIRADGDGPLGAVEYLFPGQAWLRRDLDDATREQAACIFAGYILQRA